MTEIDEFKGAWMALGNIAPDRLLQLQKVATIESIASSTRIEGSLLTDRQVEKLIGNLKIQKFETRDEQEVDPSVNFEFSKTYLAYYKFYNKPNMLKKYQIWQNKII